MSSDFTTKQINNFWKKVNISPNTDDCWEWRGALFYDGYGQFAVNGKSKKAHRVSFEMKYGEIPAGLFVCHHCDNRKCVNPKHLFLGTNADNMRDMVSKNRQIGHPSESNGRAKITRDDVATIRTQYEQFGLTHRQLAKLYNISHVQVGRIIRKILWKD